MASLIAPPIPVSGHCASAARGSVALLLFLGSIGLVGVVTTGLFFGSGFALLGQPSEQMHAESGAGEPDIGDDLERVTGPTANAENSTTFSGGTETPALGASEATMIASVQTAAPGKPAKPSLVAASPAARGQGTDHTRKLSRPSHPQSDAMPGATPAAPARNRSAEPDPAQNPEDHSADGTNQQEYNQLHATGPAVTLAADVSSQ